MCESAGIGKGGGRWRRYASYFRCVTPAVLLFLAPPSRGGERDASRPTPESPGAVVRLDVSETPSLRAWGEQARALVQRWYPRICNLLPTLGFTPPREVVLRFRKSDRGIAGTSGNVITVHSGWVTKHPDDVGLVIHELTHVVQDYGACHGPGWITEGIADYIRWAIFEGKPLRWFPRPRKAHGYRDGYRTAAGFFLWLESGRAPGIVKKINTAMRRDEYTDRIFEASAGRSLDELWAEYAGLTAQRQ